MTVEPLTEVPQDVLMTTFDHSVRIVIVLSIRYTTARLEFTNVTIGTMVDVFMKSCSSYDWLQSLDVIEC